MRLGIAWVTAHGAPRRPRTSVEEEDDAALARRAPGALDGREPVRAGGPDGVQRAPLGLEAAPEAAADDPLGLELARAVLGGVELGEDAAEAAPAHAERHRRHERVGRERDEPAEVDEQAHRCLVADQGVRRAEAPEDVRCLRELSERA
jgi:hypothetical protein